jgi:ABC-type lipoprotein release transport system permease subunit
MIKLYWKLGWRNLFRNTRRSLIAGTAIGLGLASLIFTDAMIRGMKTNMILAGTATFLGDAQIHRTGYRLSPEVDETIPRPQPLIDSLMHEPLVRAVAPRVFSFAMVSSASQVQAVQMVGIDPEQEPALSRVDETVIQGHYLSCPDCHEMMIGSGLAKLLEVELGDRIVLTVSEAITGDLSQELMRVAAVFHYDEKEMDEGMVFIPIRTAQTMLNVYGVHEIALLFTSPDVARTKPEMLWQTYNTKQLELVGWPDLLPQLEAALALTDFSTFLVGIILFGVVALSIINTLFMGIHERMFEFGVLRAVGTRPGGVAQLIIYESFALAVLSIVIGSLLGLGITGLVNYTGIDYRGIEFAGVTFQSVIYPELTHSQFIVYPFWVLILTVMVGLYPSVHAARLIPSQAIRKSI